MIRKNAAARARMIPHCTDSNALRAKPIPAEWDARRYAILAQKKMMSACTAAKNMTGAGYKKGIIPKKIAAGIQTIRKKGETQAVSGADLRMTVGTGSNAQNYATLAKNILIHVRIA